jgi:integrase
MPLATVRKRYRDKDKPNEKFMGFQCDYVDQHGKRHAKLFSLERDAKAYLAKVAPEVRAGTHTPERQSITVAEAADLWLDHCRTVEKLVSATITQYTNHVRRHIKPNIGNLKLSDLSAARIEKFKDDMLRVGTSRAMVVKVLVSTKAILKEAMRQGKVAQNVAIGVKPPKAKSGDRPKLKIGRDVPTKNEIRDILKAAEGSRWHAILATAALAGLRSSELRGLMWSDVDLAQVTIHVQRRADENNEMGPPKSEAGDRVIQVSSLLTNILKRWKLGCPKGELGLCFPTGIGTVESHANIANRAWYKFQVDLGIVKPATYEDGKPIMEPVLDEKGKPVIGAKGKPEMRQSSRPKYGLHAARHFFASCMIEAGHLPKRLQEMMGHASLQMTYDRYGHLFPAGDGERAKMESAADFLHATKTA